MAKNRLTFRELVDHSSNVSSTRWAFASVVILDISLVVVAFIVSLVLHIIGKPLDNSFYSNFATLLGIVTSLVTTSKILQGFETKKEDPVPTQVTEAEVSKAEIVEEK